MYYSPKYETTPELSWLNMEHSWDYSDSSNSSLADSDKVDSETEAKLYSFIHHFSSELPKMSSSTFYVYLYKDEEANESYGIKEYPLPDKEDETVFLWQKQSANHGCDGFKQINELPLATIKNILNKSIFFAEKFNESDILNIWFVQDSADESDSEVTDVVDLADSNNESDVSSASKKTDSLLKNSTKPKGEAEEIEIISESDGQQLCPLRYFEYFPCSNCNEKDHISSACPGIYVD